MTTSTIKLHPQMERKIVRFPSSIKMCLVYSLGSRLRSGLRQPSWKGFLVFIMQDGEKWVQCFAGDVIKMIDITGNKASCCDKVNDNSFLHVLSSTVYYNLLWFSWRNHGLHAEKVLVHLAWLWGDFSLIAEEKNEEHQINSLHVMIRQCLDSS